MKVLVACEESQRVCIAFRERGHEAYSCDIIEQSGGHPEWHIKGNCLDILSGGAVMTQDLTWHKVDRWDLIIAHPPCTYLSNAATRSFSIRCTDPEEIIKRWEERAKAAVFFMKIAAADCDRICIENPMGFMNNAYRKADQIIHPYYFAESSGDKENYVQKRTCLWLKGLPPLTRKTDLPVPEGIYVTSTGKKVGWCEGMRGIQGGRTARAKARSKTFPGIAKAMAEQWG